MKLKKSELFNVIISFRLLKEKIENLKNTTNKVIKAQAEEALEIFKNNPELISGVDATEIITNKKNEIDQIMALVFPPVLTSNEIKAAVFPYSNDIFYTSNRLQEIIDNAATEENIFNDLYKDHANAIDLLTYAIILNTYYNYNVDFERPKTISVINKNGIRKKYRVTFNADFLDIYPNKNAIEITEAIANELLSNADDTEIWKKYFPDNSWTIEGFGLISLTATSLDEEIDDFKSHLIQPNRESFKQIENDIRKIFKLPNLKIGSFSVEDDKTSFTYEKKFDIFSLTKNESVSINDFGCENINAKLFQEFQPAVIANVEAYHKQTGGNRLSNRLLNNNVKSIAMIPIVIDEELKFVIELATDKINQINVINMVKFQSIMPFILSYSERTINEYKNEISAIIQEECTSIHQSVQWKFEEEANKYLLSKNSGEIPVFQEIVFKDVLPMYGQTDIVGSSSLRNLAIQKDLTQQLNKSKEILKCRIVSLNQPFFEQLIYQIDKFIYEINEDFHTNSEQEVNLFFNHQILPLFNHLIKNKADNSDIEEFLKIIDNESKTFYLARKEYDCAIDITNKLFASFIDKQQVIAQEIFPHYFEKFRTDGIEHNLYIGQSIVKNQYYHPSVLYNLRLWQLQSICEMEALFYKKQKDFTLKLEVASLILAYDVPITIRYRMDEKKFDVDGAYNVRYEMIKKRIDKAHIKNSTERLTQPHKLCIVYSSNAIEREYLAYLDFLQSKNYVGKNIEILELEELQGASGIKAIRVDINHQLEKNSKAFTIEDLQNV